MMLSKPINLDDAITNFQFKVIELNSRKVDEVVAS